ncbi:hypothetical protein ARMGADRAFT_1033804 [Armillaria gallica]|uniref:Uncharacterized protein n=1 Tax=Armillaria gallica TaxID=47427 RepID=A0A2H3DIC3_ARMGA|nr:hypothetical protein ARMGADRAFT_1033804 [Armillaria gallica]
MIVDQRCIAVMGYDNCDARQAGKDNGILGDGWLNPRILSVQSLEAHHRLEISAIHACNSLSLGDIQSTIRLLSLSSAGFLIATDQVNAAVAEFQRLLIDQVHTDTSTQLQERLHQTRTLHEACQRDRNIRIADLERALTSAENDVRRLEADLQRSREIHDAEQYRQVQEVTDIPMLKRYLDQEFETLGKLLQGGTTENSDERESVMSW